jgi:hypothetical protein
MPVFSLWPSCAVRDRDVNSINNGNISFFIILGLNYVPDITTLFYTNLIKIGKLLTIDG